MSNLMHFWEEEEEEEEEEEVPMFGMSVCVSVRVSAVSGMSDDDDDDEGETRCRHVAYLGRIEQMLGNSSSLDLLNAALYRHLIRKEFNKLRC
ncbi:hypothetical protein ANN_25861 [Periplaneta americana]|uniref:Uncharacterized protein n=1 Tax=Periplaneta americana TaxID=6978 RepID=A0ABQ8S4L1_PERAM|nr:hypothetical protein ANN_25861 [Periplaneta americana]